MHGFDLEKAFLFVVKAAFKFIPKQLYGVISRMD